MDILLMILTQKNRRETPQGEIMLHHIVCWTLKEKDAAENARRIREASATLSAIPSVLSVEVSIEVLPTSTLPAQVVLQSTHNTPEDLQAYAVHPIHLEFGKLIREACENRQALDYMI